MNVRISIAIDGPAGSGKSTIAKELASLLNITYINTGLMYRAIAVLASKAQSDQEIILIANETTFEFGRGGEFAVNGIDFLDRVRSPAIVPAAAKIAVIGEVRGAISDKLRPLAQETGLIVEGRDTGKNVLPNADWKFYLDAELHVRAKRLFGDMSEAERAQFRSIQHFQETLEGIDQSDMNRTHGPLELCEDAIYHKTSRFSSREEAIVLLNYISSTEHAARNYEIIGRKLLRA
jgi:cytidylate kinase